MDDTTTQLLFECWHIDESVGLLQVTGTPADIEDADLDEHWKQCAQEEPDVEAFAKIVEELSGGKLKAKRVWYEQLHSWS